MEQQIALAGTHHHVREKFDHVRQVGCMVTKESDCISVGFLLGGQCKVWRDIQQQAVQCSLLCSWSRRNLTHQLAEQRPLGFWRQPRHPKVEVHDDEIVL
jgi:hypothetical protein